ncbi:MAG: UvrB/UvrC motif-containing protein [Acutalibacteraceae bacterium]|jgi:protein arginine kinase activator
MLCEKCGKNEATMHIRTVINGVMTERNYCGYCAAEEGFDDFANTSVAGMLASMFGELMPTKLSSIGTKKCPVCGATFADIAESGKVGCADCYLNFESQLLPYLKRVHGSTKHVGKIPNSAPLTVVPKEDTIESLRMELNRLVAEERYEEAAVIRDKIKKMEGKGNE